MLDAMKIGGVTIWMRAAALAAAHGLEYADWWSAILKEQVNIEDGRVVATRRAGSGIEWDEVP
jgi:L-alanine-DL-glutamate epimerase-like enolase superfamily enzyme